MLPPIKECQERVSEFNNRYPNSTFDEFWSYKLEVEKYSSSSILDHSYLNETVRLLNEKLLRHPKWGLWWTGIPPVNQIGKILSDVRPEYNTIKDITLGNGEMANKKVIKALSLIYAKLCGISHNRWGDFPNSTGESYLVGKSKVLMFIWGQVPGFDSRLRENPSLWSLPHLWVERTKYTPLEFCDILGKLDQWVVAWDEEQKRHGVFQSLSPNRPVGRIIDIIYWMQIHLGSGHKNPGC